MRIDINENVQLTTSHDEIELRFFGKQCTSWLALTIEDAEKVLQGLPKLIETAKAVRAETLS
ncbi:hypothetical protein AN911_00815 [Mycobacteroides immunogenum]|jgi:hypothetical protein|uniref:Uncharacterized protein n=1 Tax=Mycobacteroides immunogenum TaxID=83262 RepID=A0A7V8RXP1_9MYCO|nr:hypothetical protein AN909_05625 [Mycobacteroides immunogenum]KPG14278.1 hypothetical protein AN908_06780 [Mycobacteroides immunogenum]KPG14354.1 hypothetical protein AN908_07290 [Mycobacteroides immunogenum]KPG17447.1 hypothetical protein AN910_04850 [Mycobacteroides immunogenum]KPG23969.1 hypothetical protein AN911_00310 [Mycobacteroides immunogenum]